jgi:hypothetical protein
MKIFKIDVIDHNEICISCNALSAREPFLWEFSEVQFEFHKKYKITIEWHTQNETHATTSSVYKCPPMDPILSHLTPIHVLTIPLRSVLTSPSYDRIIPYVFFSDFLLKILPTFHTSRWVLHVQSISYPLFDHPNNICWAGHSSRAG